MISTERFERLSNKEVDQCLQVVLKGFIARHSEYGRIVSAPEEAVAAMDAVVQQLGISKPSSKVETASTRRQVLALLAQDPATAPWVDAWIEGHRPTLLEPITTAIVLASLVMVLSANFAVDVETKNGKTSLKVHIDKKPTANAILKKFFNLL
jgi:hypothetical protein